MKKIFLLVLVFCAANVQGQTARALMNIGNFNYSDSGVRFMPYSNGVFKPSKRILLNVSQLPISLSQGKGRLVDYDTTAGVMLGTSKVIIGDQSKVGAATFIEFTKGKNDTTNMGYAIPQKLKFSVGPLGTAEMNISVNMDYTTGSHKAYDSTLPAMWYYIGNTNGMGMQYVPGGNPNSSIFYNYGEVIWSAVPFNQIVTGGGNAKRFMSTTNTAVLNLVDQSYPATAGNDIQLYQQNAAAYLTAGSGTLREFSVPKLRVSSDGYNFVTDATALATFTHAASNTYSVYQNVGNNANYNSFRFLKNKAGSYNLGSGQKVVEFDYNGGIAFSGVRATSTVLGGFSNIEYYWKTTNATGTLADRMVLDEEGSLNIYGRMRLGNMAAPPTPTGGGIIYVQGGALKYIGTSGTVTTIAAP